MIMPISAGGAVIVVAIVIAVIVIAALVDWRTRRRGSTVRRGDEIRQEIRQQELWTQGRQSIRFRKTGDDDGPYSPDREKRLGR
jgi:hypothetical protein